MENESNFNLSHFYNNKLLIYIKNNLDNIINDLSNNKQTDIIINKIKDLINIINNIINNNVKKIEQIKLDIEQYHQKINNQFEISKKELIGEEDKYYNPTSNITDKPLIINDLIRPIENEFDIVYLMDATGSMGDYLAAVRDQCKNIFNEVKRELTKFDFRFGAVFYRDPVDSPNEKNNIYSLKKDKDILKDQISLEKPYGGGDGPEDWVGGFDLALNRINWGNGIRLIIHIADAPAHGSEWCGFSNHNEENHKLYEIVQKTIEKNIKIIAFQIGSYPNLSFKKFQSEYIEKKGKLYKIFEFGCGLSAREVTNSFKQKVIEAINVASTS